MNLTTHPKEHVPELRGLRVLVADDSQDLLDLLSAFLTRAGCIVDTASSGEEALSRAKRNQPAIALLDIEMPTLSGYEVAAALRSSAGFEHVPLVALTGYAERYHWLRTIEAGFTSYVVKPIDFASLAQLIVRLSREKRGVPSV